MESRNLILALALVAGCQRASAESVPGAGGPAGEPAAHEEEEHAGHEHGGEEGASDLDRSVEELRAQTCEHGIPAYRCAECRYEVGMVPAPAATGTGGAETPLIATARVGTRALPSSLEVVGEVVVADDRTVHVSSRTAGVIHGTPVRLGHDVAPGDVLVELDSPELANATALPNRSHTTPKVVLAASAARPMSML